MLSGSPQGWNLARAGTVYISKDGYWLLGEEGSWQPLSDYHLPYLFLKKSSTSGKPPIFVCVNKRRDGEVMVEEWMIPLEVKSCKSVYSLLGDEFVPEQLPYAFELEPADVILFTR